MKSSKDYSHLNQGLDALKNIAYIFKNINN